MGRREKGVGGEGRLNVKGRRVERGRNDSNRMRVVMVVVIMRVVMVAVVVFIV